MSCEILELQGVTLNGSTKAYGGALQSFSMSLNGIASQVKATATLVGASSAPGNGDKVTVGILGSKNMKMQVGGYEVKSSASGGDTITLQLYDTSNIFLDNNHIVLKEEIPEEGGVPGNVFVLGLKYGPLPSPIHAKEGIITADSDTKWGDLRHFYELETPSCEEEEDEEKSARIDQNIKGATGKTLWPATGGALIVGGVLVTHSLQSALGGVLNGNSELVGGEFDFKGTFRDVIVQYCNALGLQAWWDLEKEEVVIKEANSTEDGFSLLGDIASQCEILSASQSVDYTPTLAKGAIGSITSSWPGENQVTAGHEQSKYLTATLLAPIFKYCKCGNKVKGQAGQDRLTELDFEDEDVLKAIQAAAHDKLFAAYALQSVFGVGDQEKIRNNILTQALDKCGVIKFTSLKGKGPEVVDNERELDVTDWGGLLPAEDAAPFASNMFLREYYEPDIKHERECSAQLCTVKIGSLAPSPGEPGVPLCGMMKNAASTPDPEEEPEDIKKAEEGDLKKGWDTRPDEDPAKTMGVFTIAGEKKLCTGGFEHGKIVLQDNPFFSSILGTKGLEGANDILRMYLLAIERFRYKFYVIKEDRSKDLRGKDQCVSQSVNVSGRSYGYYITSEVQNAPLSLEPPDGHKLISLNPFVPLGESSCAELVALAQTLSMMYLPDTKRLAEVMGLRADPDNPAAVLAGIEKAFPGRRLLILYMLWSLMIRTYLRACPEKKQG